MERARVERVYLATETLGSWYFNGALICKTLELPKKNSEGKEDVVNETCFKEGIYIAVKEPPTKHFPYPHFRFSLDPWTTQPERPHSTIPGRAGICVHKITFVSGLLGCIGVGSAFADLDHDGVPDIVESTKALYHLYDVMPDKFEVEIVEKPQPTMK